MSDLEEVDNRLFQIWGQRPTALRPDLLPDVARAIVGLYRKQVSVTLGITKNVPYVLLKGSGLVVQILADDWAKIEPYIKDGSLDPLLVPMNLNGYSDPNTTFSLPLLSVKDPYYVYVLGILTPLFP